MIKFDKEKYIEIIKSKGLPAALTALHHDLDLLENTTFEGRAGWQPEMWNAMHAMRDFSRDLWDQRYTDNVT